MFNVNRHLNLTNVCSASCAYCSFQRKPGEKDAYAMRIEEAVRLAKAMESESLTELLVRSSDVLRLVLERHRHQTVVIVGHSANNRTPQQNLSGEGR